MYYSSEYKLVHRLEPRLPSDLGIVHQLKHISCYVVLEVLIAVVTNVAIFLDIAPCIPYVNRRFGGTYHLYFQGQKLAEQGTSVQ
jgi:hypothetical protein